MPAESTKERGDPIAIVGAACLFPGCQTPDELWEHIRSGTCTTTDVPPGRWLIDADQALDPRIALPDHVYSTKGGYITLPPLDRTGLDIEAELLDRLDPLFHLVLHVASSAWRDARTEAVDRSRTGVIFGNIVLPTETASAWSREHFRRLFEDGLGICSSPALETHPLNAFPAGLPAALTARALRLGGAAYTLDAACSSSLFALKLAVDELRSGRADAMICGGVSRPDPLYTQMGFSQLRALSVGGKPAPFDADADGLVVGEGAGMFVLKRLADALAHGDHIHGVVAGIGLSNDVHGDLLAPSAEGQLRAMRQAYEQAGWSPSDVDLIECHATGTPKGDGVELESLGELWREDPGRKKNACVIGSVKSNIGHTLTAAGAAGLLKVLLALRHRVLPPSARFQKPHPALALNESPFRIVASPEPWPARFPDRPRRAAVSGFGFGGINAHVLIEEWPPVTLAGTAPSIGDMARAKTGQHFRVEDSPGRADFRLESLTYDTPTLAGQKKNRAPVAIVGMAAQFGSIGQRRSFREHFVGAEPAAQPSRAPNWWGMQDTQWYRQAGWDDRSFPGYYLESLPFRLDQFRIPPKELAEMLPQQSLMLDVAARALRHASWQAQMAPRTAVIIGIGLDLNTTNYHWRWSSPGLARSWSELLGLDLTADEFAKWVESLRASGAPPLSANRTMGSLGGVVASRIAREFQIGGPSFSVSCDENSGIQALAIAVDLLHQNEVDAAVVGAVDFAGDIRAVLARARLYPEQVDTAGQDGTVASESAITPVACDGAVCLVLKRLDDATRKGDRIAAIIREVTVRREPFASSTTQSPSVADESPSWSPGFSRSAESQGPIDEAPSWSPGFSRSAESLGAKEEFLQTDRSVANRAEPPIGYLDVQAPDHFGQPRGMSRTLKNSAMIRASNPHGGCAVGSILSDLGHVGAVTGLAAVAKVAVCLAEQMIPAPRGSAEWLSSLAEGTSRLFVPSGQQFWLRNRALGPRRAAVHVASLGGILGEVVLEESESTQDADHSPLGRCEARRPRTCGLFVLDAGDPAGYHAQIAELGRMARATSSGDIDALAWRWWERHRDNGRSQLATAIVAESGDTLAHLLEIAASGIEDLRLEERGPSGAIFAARRDVAKAGPASVAFVYPGLGSHFAAMGRELSAIFPDVLRTLDAESRAMRDQFDPALWWNRAQPGRFLDHRHPILATVWVGGFVTEILRQFGVSPQAAIGYSLGESTALLALHAWTDCEELCSRIQSSPLFQTELAGLCEAARRCWKLGSTELVDWVAGIVCYPAEAVDAVISPGEQVYVLVRNSAEQTVIGGQRQAVVRVVKELAENSLPESRLSVRERKFLRGAKGDTDFRPPPESLGASFVELPHVSTIHCDIGRMVESDYRALHDLETSTPEGITFYSGVWGRSYAVDRRTAAEAITAQATHRIDFPAVIERAYQDGVRVFVEVGPGASCTRHIDRILGARPHAALSACRADGEPFGTILEVLGTLLASGVPVNLAPLYGSERRADPDGSVARTRLNEPAGRVVNVEVRGRAFAIPRPGRVEDHTPPNTPPLECASPPPLTKGGPGGVDPAPPSTGPADDSKTWPSVASPQTLHSDFSRLRQPAPDLGPPPRWGEEIAPEDAHTSALVSEGASWSRRLYEAAHATAEAHRAFLRTSQRTADLISGLIAFQFGSLQSDDGHATEAASLPRAEPSVLVTNESLQEASGKLHSPRDPARFALGPEQCLEFAVGSIAGVLGPEYAPIDRFPTRVRLPDQPLLLVDRILTIEGQPRSLQAGRVVTEHVVKPDAWYLDGGKVPACIAIEAGQADLFLSAYLGADFVTEGRAVYRLLDATVTFWRGLPEPGDVIRYDIRITRFFRQGSTMLFRFQFDATIDGKLLLSMRDGCAGFFSAEELAAGKGIVAHRCDRGGRMAPPAGALDDLVPMTPAALDERQVEALRAGDLVGAFGAGFDRVAAIDPVRVPAGRMALLHRISLLDPKGGPHGFGLIRAEADIRPDDWFLVCHFVDDRVMPGTLMYECCLHALRILLMRIGWVGPRDQVAFEPAAGIASRLRCRGQVVESTRLVTYEVVIKELGYQPHPIAIADALIFADGKPIVEVMDMAVQLAGIDRQGLEALWASRPAEGSAVAASADPAAQAVVRDGPGDRALFDHERILEFAVGKPSAAFGDRYRVFDEGRFIARLPAPPFQFIHRITRIDAEPWVMAAGSAAMAEYDIAADAWYFEADRQESVPHAVLLETALQSCGWLAAYMGSALHSDDDLKFRILGGTASKHREVTRRSGTLSTSVKAAKISKTAGMILQQFEYSIHSREGLVYDGVADLGFFHPRLLEDREGIRDFAPCAGRFEEQAVGRSFAFPAEPPFPGEPWRMVEEIHDLRLEGAPHGLGGVRGSARVDPDCWLFKAHFLGDPVWPGSLGQESLLQLLKAAASARWGATARSRFESPGLATAHGWTYCGQITPVNRLITIQAEIKQCDDTRRWLLADGYLDVDGRVIYQMKDYSLRLYES